MSSHCAQEISSLATAFDVLAKLSPTRSHVESIVFRGQADARWKLVPTLYRTVNFFDRSIDRPMSINTFVQSRHALESIYIAKFFQKAELHLNNPRRGFASDRILAQHFGVPTRLLDWTANPLFALYFCVCDPVYEDRDGALFFLRPANRMGHKLPEEDNLQTAHAHDLWLVDPPYLDQRIPSQSAKLTFHTIHSDATHFEPVEEQQFPPGSHKLHKLLVPAGVKGQIYRELLEIGVNHHTIFPDLQGLGEQIRRDFLLGIY